MYNSGNPGSGLINSTW